MLDENSKPIPKRIALCDWSVFRMDIPQVCYEYSILKKAQAVDQSWLWAMMAFDTERKIVHEVIDTCSLFGVHFLYTHFVSEDVLPKTSDLVRQADLIFLPRFEKSFAPYTLIRQPATADAFVSCVLYFSQAVEPFNKKNAEWFLESYGA